VRRGRYRFGSGERDELDHADAEHVEADPGRHEAWEPGPGEEEGGGDRGVVDADDPDHEVGVEDPVDVRLLQQRPELVRVDPGDERVGEEEEGEPNAQDEGRVEDGADPRARRCDGSRRGDGGPWASPDCGDTGFLLPDWYFSDL
jgi:hypothetical protein